MKKILYKSVILTFVFLVANFFVTPMAGNTVDPIRLLWTSLAFFAIAIIVLSFGNGNKGED